VFSVFFASLVFSVFFASLVFFLFTGFPEMFLSWIYVVLSLMIK